MIDAATFRALFPMFGDSERYPDAMINWHMEGAAEQCGPRWGRLRERGVMLLCAHTVTLWTEAGKVGGIEAAAGPITSESKSVGGISKSQSRAGPGATSDPGAGNYAATIWGSQYYELMLQAGMGGLSV